MENSSPSSSTKLRQMLRDKEVHIRNLEALIGQRDEEIERLRGDLADSALREASRARTRDFWTPPPRSPEADAATLAALAPPTWSQAVRAWWWHRAVESYWMRVGTLVQYEPRPLRPETFPPPRQDSAALPQIAVVTPSFNQAPFIEATLRSVLDQAYPRLLYAVYDGASTDASPALIARHTAQLAAYTSAPDSGQSDAIGKGFAQLTSRLGPDDLMGWLNSDDLLMPGALRHVAEYFARHPGVDVIYGHRVIIDDNGGEVGRWILPRHEPGALEWVDYVPQETLFWRKRAWDRVGGLNPDFHFALDWDLLARFTQAGLKIVRLPYFLGCFRVHEAQKTSRNIHSTGAEEMARVRVRFHGMEKAQDLANVERWARRIRWRGMLTARLLALGLRW